MSASARRKRKSQYWMTASLTIWPIRSFHWHYSIRKDPATPSTGFSPYVLDFLPGVVWWGFWQLAVTLRESEYLSQCKAVSEILRSNEDMSFYYWILLEYFMIAFPQVRDFCVVQFNRKWTFSYLCILLVFGHANVVSLTIFIFNTIFVIYETRIDTCEDRSMALEEEKRRRI